MKTKLDKTLENIASKKQMTFGVPEKQIVKKGTLKKAQPTYWVCKKGHVFEHKYRIHPDREKELKCPICRDLVKNKSSKSTYLYYLKRTGRVDEKAYRVDQIRKKKLQEQKEMKTELEPREENA